MKQTIVFDAYTNTIRQNPENHLIAHFNDNMKYWVCDPAGANKELATKVFHALFEYDNKYERDGQKLVDRINSGE